MSNICPSIEKAMQRDANTCVWEFCLSYLLIVAKQRYKSIQQVCELKNCSHHAVTNAIKRGDLNGGKRDGTWMVKNDWLLYRFRPRWVGGRTHKPFREKQLLNTKER